MRDAGVKGHLFISWINLTITAVQHPCQCAGVSQWLSVAAPHFCHRDDAWGLFWVKKKTCRSQEHLKWERDYVEITIDLYFHINALFLALISILTNKSVIKRSVWPSIEFWNPDVALEPKMFSRQSEIDSSFCFNSWRGRSRVPVNIQLSKDFCWPPDKMGNAGDSIMQNISIHHMHYNSQMT